MIRSDYSTCTDLSILRDRIEELEELLACSKPVVQIFNLTNKEMLLCSILASRVSVSKEHLYLTIYSGLGEVNSKIIDVFVCKARRKLPADIKILTIWGRGYSMSLESRKLWHKHMEVAQREGDL